ncbi:Ribulose-phosphate 3-epimerase (EC [uncultured Gammaproteobacteria bacterium]|nr:Ribulose-phosphate 3-epimerase (EC [uncultured Gammaproteobacteria bacterium]
MNNHQNAIFHQLDNFIKHSHSFAMTIFHTITKSAKLVILLIILLMQKSQINYFFNNRRKKKQANFIAPSILAADFAKLGEEVDTVLSAGADIVHFDVMDNHYVPNLTIGPLVCEALRNHGVSAPIDVHLMVKPVDRIIPDFIAAGASYITFHPEASEHIDRTLGMIKEAGCKAGLVFNPATPLQVLENVMDKLDMILLMSVNPGFGGQSFIPHTLEKCKQVRQLIDASGKDIRLEIDGGVKIDNIREVASAGADTFVAGSAIFNTDNYKATIDKMRAELAKAN